MTDSEALDPIAPPPPPELVFREVVLSESRTQIPPWLTMALAVSLGLICVLAMGMSLQMRQILRLRVDLAGLTQQLSALSAEQAELQEALLQLRGELGGLHADVRQMDEGGIALPPAESFTDTFPGADASHEPESEPEHPVRNRGAGLGGLLPGGVWTGGF